MNNLIQTIKQDDYINYSQQEVEIRMSSPIQIQQIWMSIIGPKISCSVIHPNNSCFYQILYKSLQVVKNSSKLYALLYLAMFAVQFRKIRSQRKLQKTIISWSKDFLWCLAFMSWLVGGMKTALCVLNNAGSPLDGRVTPLLSILGSPAIYCIQKSRRPEVVLFAFVRAIRSSYIYLKKRYRFKISSERELCFIFIYGILSYFFFQKPEDLRNKQFLLSMWGEF